MTTPVTVTDYSFDPEVLKCDIPVLADFWAEWCGPCQPIAAYLEEIAKEYAGQLKVVRLDIEANPLITSAYAVLNLPTLILFKNGRPVERLEGSVPQAALLQSILPHLNR